METITSRQNNVRICHDTSIYMSVHLCAFQDHLQTRNTKTHESLLISNQKRLLQSFEIM